MNCKQVDKFLPLYAGADLDQRREQLIAAHVQTCASCAAAVVEYRDSRQLFAAYETPAFSEDFYTTIRQNVWREIETQQTRWSWSDLFTTGWTPRLAWSVAIILFLAVFGVGVYRFAQGNLTPSQAETKMTATNQLPRTDIVSPPPGPKPTVVAGTKHPQSIRSRAVRPRKESFAAANPVTASAIRPRQTIDSSPVSDEPLQSQSVTEAPTVLRAEIQTRNPNIRIIWLSHQDSTTVPRNSRGI